MREGRGPTKDRSTLPKILGPCHSDRPPQVSAVHALYVERIIALHAKFRHLGPAEDQELEIISVEESKSPSMIGKLVEGQKRMDELKRRGQYYSKVRVEDIDRGMLGVARLASEREGRIVESGALPQGRTGDGGSVREDDAWGKSGGVGRGAVPARL